MKGESIEVGILNRVKGHRNIVEVLRFCEDPYSVMMEYVCFDISHFGVNKKVSSLEDSQMC